MSKKYNVQKNYTLFKPSGIFNDVYKIPKYKTGMTKQQYFDVFKELNIDKFSGEEIIEYNGTTIAKRKSDKYKTTVRTFEYDDEYKNINVRNLAKYLKEYMTTDLNYVTKNEIFINNAIYAMKKFGVYEQFLNMIRKPDGRFSKVDYNKFVYTGNGIYIYDNRVMIDFKDSPARIILTKLDNTDYDPKEK